jgi:hypothetical protein
VVLRELAVAIRAAAGFSTMRIGSRSAGSDVVFAIDELTTGRVSAETDSRSLGALAGCVAAEAGG